MNHNQNNEEPKKFRIPKTIDELKQWYKDMNLPHETVTRFFIGKNVTYKRAFGIYQDPETNNFIVYKNKDTGERKIRYKGSNEAHAVKELYDRLVAEIKNQKTHNAQVREQHNLKNNKLQKKKWCSGKVSNNTYDKKTIYLLILLFAVCIFLIFGPISNTGSYDYSSSSYSNRPTTGYYYYNNSLYYYLHGLWYVNDGNNNWSEYNGDTSELDKNYKNYEDNNDSPNADEHTFEDSKYYSNDDYSYDSGSSSDYSGSWDSGSSWSSSDSWSSSSTDFSSDW